MMLPREYALEVFRAAVLEALDRASHEVFGEVGLHGAKDADLPRLFKAVDAQVDCLGDRFDVKLAE